MLVSLATVLQKAQRQRYAVGSFNTANLELTQAILAAAERLHAPVIISTTEKAIAYGSMTALAAMVSALGRRSKIPVVLNLDHGHSLATVREAIRHGYTGVMFDGSKFPYEKNEALTRRAVQLCAVKKISVEAELGTVAGQAEVLAHTLQLTDPQQAKRFVRATGIHALAVAIGSAHGKPLPQERLDFLRLQQIHRVVKVPLVLHGASSTPPSRVRRAIQLGITKLNIDTDLRVSFTEALRKYLSAHKSVYDPREPLGASRSAVQRVVEGKIRLFGSVGKA